MMMTSQTAGTTHRKIVLNFRVSFVKFSYWLKFHVSINTGSGVMTIFDYKGFSQKSGNGKYPYLSFAQYLETGMS